MSSIAINRAAPAAPATGTAGVVLGLASNPILPCNVSLPGKLALEGKRFSVRAEGNAIVAAGTTTFKPTLVAALAIPASPLVISSWTTIAAGAAVAIGTADLAAPWWIHADLIFDSTSGYLQGIWNQLVNNGWTAPAAIGSQLSLMNGSNNTVTQGSNIVAPADPVAYFALAMTFSAAGANTGNLMNFEVSF